MSHLTTLELTARPFFTDQQTAQLMQNWYTAEQDHKPVVKLSLLIPNQRPMGWLFYALDPTYPDLASGLCDHGWGVAFMDMIYLPHLLADAAFRQTPLLRDLTFVGQYPLSVYAQAAQWRQGITTDPADLAQASRFLHPSQKHVHPRP